MAFLETLETILKQRKQDLPEDSYTAKLFSGNIDRLLKKVTEEAGEVIIAAKNNDPEELKNESADLLFHLMLVLVKQGISVNEVVEVLESRHNK